MICFSFTTDYASDHRREYEHRTRHARIEQRRQVRQRVDLAQQARQDQQNYSAINNQDDFQTAQAEKRLRRDRLINSTFKPTFLRIAQLSPKEIASARNAEQCMVCKETSSELQGCAVFKTICCKKPLCQPCRKSLFQAAFNMFDNYSNQAWLDAYIQNAYSREQALSLANKNDDNDDSNVTDEDLHPVYYTPKSERELQSLEIPKCPNCQAQPVQCTPFIPKVKQSEKRPRQ